jgi:hypothetical protein
MATTGAGMALRNMLIALMLSPLAGCYQPQPQPIGQTMDVQIDVGRHGNDVAFWWGTPPNDILAVIGRDLRSDVERAAGVPAAHAIDAPPTGLVTLRGTVERVPHAEATYSWGLTRADEGRLAAKGVYLRLHQIAP